MEPIDNRRPETHRLNETVRLVLMADTHGNHLETIIPDGDILIIAGDISRQGELREVIDFNTFLGDLPHAHKILIAGNHDFCLEKRPEESRSCINNAIYLQDEETTAMGLKFYGSPWTPWFMDWAFNLHPGKALKEKWDMIPPGIDVLITHGPPYRHGDRSEQNERLGDKDLLEAVKRIGPRLHIFGHIHEGYGEYRVGETTLINASLCNAWNYIKNKPVVYEIQVNREP
jgi:Icc-related predicted phosphoesterase